MLSNSRMHKHNIWYLQVNWHRFETNFVDDFFCCFFDIGGSTRKKTEWNALENTLCDVRHWLTVLTAWCRQKFLPSFYSKLTHTHTLWLRRIRRWRRRQRICSVCCFGVFDVHSTAIEGGPQFEHMNYLFSALAALMCEKSCVEWLVRFLCMHPRRCYKRAYCEWRNEKTILVKKKKWCRRKAND